MFSSKMSVVRNSSCTSNRNCRCYGKRNTTFLRCGCGIGDYLLERSQCLMVSLGWLVGGQGGLMKCTVRFLTTRVGLSGKGSRCRELCSLILRAIVVGGRWRLATTVGRDFPIGTSVQLALPIRPSVVSGCTERQRPIVMTDWRYFKLLRWNLWWGRRGRGMLSFFFGRRTAELGRLPTILMDIL